MAKHVTDFSRNSHQIIIDLVNEQNGANVPYGAVELIDLVATPESKATRITANSLIGSGYRGSQTFTYNRLYLTEVPDIVQDVTLETELEKLSDVLTFINTGWGINLQPDDVTINGVDLTENDPDVNQEYDVDQKFTLVCLANNPVWMGSLDFTLTKTRVDLSDIVHLRLHDGLYPPMAWPNVPIFGGTGGDVRIREDGSYRGFVL